MTPHQLPPDLKREVEKIPQHCGNPDCDECKLIVIGATWMYERMKGLETALEKIAKPSELIEKADEDDEEAVALAYCETSWIRRKIAKEALEEFRKGMG